MSYAIAPCTVKAALKKVSEVHRKLPELQGGLFAVKVLHAGEWVGVGVFGNPSRVWQDTGRGVIARCAVREKLPPVGNHAAPGCTLVYGALCRAAKALGYREAWTYTLPNEPGTSLRAAGFINLGTTDGGEWDRPSRSRKAAKFSEPKLRWLREIDKVMYQVRRNGQHFLRPIDPDKTDEWPISEKEFFARWRRWGGKEAEIKKAESSKEDIDVF